VCHIVQEVDYCVRIGHTRVLCIKFSLTQKGGRTLLQVEELSKVFIRNKRQNGKKNKETKEEFYAVDHLSLQVEKGEIVGILGPNGAGKTTLLRMLGCLMEPTSGTVTLFNEQGEKLTDLVECKKQIGYLSENTKLYQRLSVREMLELFAEIYKIDRKEAKERITDIFRVLDMEEFCDNRIGKLSTGQTQRASIARCLLHNPEIYIFDEPTLGLDVISSESIVNFMKQEKERGKAVVYSTHYMEEAQYLCDRIYMLHKGTIIAQGTPASLMKETHTDNLRNAFMQLIKGETNHGTGIV